MNPRFANLNERYAVRVCAILLVLLAGCCTTKDTFQTREVPFKPDPVVDSLRTLLALKVEPNCDSAVAAAFELAGNFVDSATNAEGDKWAVTVQTLQDSIDALKVKHFTRTTSIAAQGHTDSVAVVFPVKEVTPVSFWDKIRLVCFWPLLILLIGETSLVALYFLVLQNPSKAIGSVGDIITKL